MSFRSRKFNTRLSSSDTVTVDDVHSGQEHGHYDGPGAGSGPGRGSDDIVDCDSAEPVSEETSKKCHTFCPWYYKVVKPHCDSVAISRFFALRLADFITDVLVLVSILDTIELSNRYSPFQFQYSSDCSTPPSGFGSVVEVYDRAEKLCLTGVEDYNIYYAFRWLGLAMVSSHITYCHSYFVHSLESLLLFEMDTGYYFRPICQVRIRCFQSL
jgi:hypothetical protein